MVVRVRRKEESEMERSGRSTMIKSKDRYRQKEIAGGTYTGNMTR